MNKSTLVTGPILLSLLCMTLIVASFSWYQAAAGEITVSGESSVSVTVSKPDDLYIAVSNKWSVSDTVYTDEIPEPDVNYSLSNVTLNDFTDSSIKTAFSSINLRNSVVNYTNSSLSIQSGNNAYVSFPSGTKTPLVAPSTALTSTNIDTSTTFHSCIFGTDGVSPVHFRFYVKNLYSATQTRTLSITPSNGIKLAVMQTTDNATPVKTLYTSDYDYETGDSSSLTSVTSVNSTTANSVNIDPTLGVYSIDISSIPSGSIYTYDIYLWCSGYKTVDQTDVRYESSTELSEIVGYNLPLTCRITIE